jgi:hypothetical protein
MVHDLGLPAAARQGCIGQASRSGRWALTEPRPAPTKIDKWQRIAGWFLTLSYAIGSPAFAIVEARTGAASQRFDYPPEFLYLVASAQFCCSLVLFRPVLAPWSIVVLTVLSIGAVASHFRIDSPVTSLPAVGYTVLQIWYGARVYRQRRIE